jgi:hypothetical protein
MYETVLTNVLKDPNAIKEYLSMMKETRSKKGGKKGGKRTKKHRKTYKKHK